MVEWPTGLYNLWAYPMVNYLQGLVLLITLSAWYKGRLEQYQDENWQCRIFTQCSDIVVGGLSFWIVLDPIWPNAR